MAEEHWKEFYLGESGGQLLGDDRFAEKARVQVTWKTMRKTSLDQVVQVICELLGIDQNELCCGSRQKWISEPRGVLALLVRDIEDLQLSPSAANINVIYRC